MLSLKDASSSKEKSRPLDIITGGEWDHVLFATYALSLSFYETQIHKLGLSRNGCRDIRILADADGYQLSLSERQSDRVGNEYRLIPAALPDGVFHPKLTWLANKDIDVVLVGSGNLTFGGFGKNVECLDLIRSDLHPNMFENLANLFGAWAERTDLKIPEKEWLQFWQDRATRIFQKSAAVDDSASELLHSSVTSIGQHLISRITRHGKAQEVRSLSPFYDPDASGIIHFAEAIGAQSLVIGLLPGKEMKTTFPFHNNRKSSLEIHAAEFDAPKDGRSLHAKVLEVLMDDGTMFLLTGSVNATRKSLLTIDNIETAILRSLSSASDSPFTWTPTSTPSTYHAPEYGKAGLGARVVVSARLTGEGLLKGTLITKANPQGIWKAALQRMDGLITDTEIEVKEDGQFVSNVIELEKFQHSAGLQLTVTRDGKEGVGWVAVDGLLLTARRGFISPGTLIKLLNSEADESDETELLRYLAVSAQRHLPVFSGRNRSPKRQNSGREQEDGKGSSAIQIPIEVLNHDYGFSQEISMEKDVEGDALLNTYISRIRSSLLRNRSVDSLVQDLDEVSDDRASDRELKDREQRRKQLIDSIEGFQEKLAQLSNQLNLGHERAAALCMWFEVTFPILLRRLDDPGEAELFVKKWLISALAGQTINNSSDILARHIISAMLTVASSEIARNSELGQTTRMLGRIHEHLEAYCMGASPTEVIDELMLFDKSAPPIVTQLLNFLPSSPSLEETLLSVLDSPTPMQQITEIMESNDRREPISRNLPILGLQAGRIFVDQIEAGRRPKVKQLDARRNEICPHCNIKMRVGEQLNLRRDRFAMCGNCSGFLLASIQ